MSALELWAGVECTVNRVGDRWFDQVRRTGHHERLDDLDRIASLGVKRMRVPVLWERVAKDGLANADWSWSDARLTRLAELGVEPIVGLVHHGSGPAYTNLCDEGFVEGLAELAGAAAARYPWVTHWTPINEPLTTARFSALYGHWYPHARDIAACLRALVIEVRATVAAMARIRRVVPGAQLVQTEDLGRIHGTSELGYQVDYENERRWLAFDLLEGRVHSEHLLRRHCEEHGIPDGWLDDLVREPCPADIIGINYYLTSDRYLDHRIERYPAHVVGGNHRQRYADVEAVRVHGVGIVGHAAVLEEAWQRYMRPVALTEVHLGCTREQQLRWLDEAFQSANALRSRGADVRAVTLWSVFGAFDWHCLVTRDEDRYEPGVFDLRAPAPRETALARFVRDLASAGSSTDALVDDRGWWHAMSSRCYGESCERGGEPTGRPLLVAGEGRLAELVLGRCRARGIATQRVGPRNATLPVGSRPWGVVAAYDVAAYRGPQNPWQQLDLARRCHGEDLPLLAFSTERTFGETNRLAPRTELELPDPDDAFSRAWSRFEQDVLAAAPASTLLVRMGTCLDPEDPCDPLANVLRRLAAGLVVRAPSDETISVSRLDEVVDRSLDLFIDGVRGPWHGTNLGVTTVLGLVRDTAARLGIPTERLHDGRDARALGLGSRPGHRALASAHAWPMSAIDRALDRYVELAASMRITTAA